ncbi:hypothetical protein [Algoriphagus sp. Y33]|uniref:hypothetical protein n=1 Tax=Algoriphagus sp. Y33 TaxID=2772483 RepID=UPI0017824357|nr:hypothetical protein [Algoriphagus sp. Y33]
MKTLLRIYLILIFAGSAMEAGSENDSINSGFSTEASNFAANSGYNQNQKGTMTNCINLAIPVDYKDVRGTGVKQKP